MSTPLRYERIYGKPTMRLSLFKKNSRVAVCMQAATRLVFILNLYPLFLFLIVCPEVEAMSL